MSGEAEYLIFLLETLREEWRDYRNLKAGARREFEQLKSGLREIEAFLRDAADMPNKNQLFKERESEIRKLVYDVEDTIEICLTKMAAAKTKSWFKQFWGNIGTEMEQKVKSLRARAQPTIDEIHQKFGIIAENNHGSSSSLENQLPEVEVETDQSPGEASSNDESNMEDKIVDFQDEATIIGYLMKSEENLDVIAVTGMAGLGKTTFAQKIFRNKRIMAKFPLRIWIHVSEKFNKRDAFQHILKEITLKEPLVQNDQQLIKSVRKILEKEEFLLVTDDVSTKDDWKAIEEILPKNNGKGKVLVTTRHIDVAAGANFMRTPHQLSFLDPEKSLKLLKLQVFDKLERFPKDKELEKVGKVIAEKCGGVPLVVLVIGGILKDIFTYNRRSIGAIKDKWSEVSKNVPKLLNEDGDKLISRALELSYRRLGHNLRLCFLYTGLFPERHVIPASTLTQLWIAEGFVQGESLEENAEKILDALIMMNFIMVEKKYLNKVKTCLVHDMVREFCRAKAMEENFFKVIEGSNPLVAGNVAFRRLCFDSDPAEFLSKDLEGIPVRSFLCFSEESVDLDAIHKSTIFNLLRVLNCRSIKIQQFPAEIKKLILLKHITLSFKDLQVLPQEISQLVNLQTLIVDTKSHSIKVKAKIWKMIQLKRVKTKAAIFLDDKNWKSKARGNLQTISRLSPKSCKADLSKRAPYLKTLGIQGKLADLVHTMSLGDFPQLEKLKLVNDLDDKSEASNPLLLTKLDCFPGKLKSLTLSKTFLEWDVHMPLLAKIENLEILKLKDNAFTGDYWLANKGASFPKLQFLLIEKLVLVKWEASNTDFPKLSSLVVKNCEKLQEIPVSLAKCRLENLEIDRVNKSVVESAMKIAETQTKKNVLDCNWEVPFNLTIGPGCDQALFSGTINADLDA